MKKSVFIMLVLILLLVLPVMAFASSDSGSTDISYTVTEAEPDPDPDPDPEPPPSTPAPPSRSPAPATYEINIPARISLNDSNTIRITANYVNIEEPDRAVIVRMDGNTFDNSTLWLTNSGPDKIGVSFYMSDGHGSRYKLEGLEPGGYVDVAYFADGDTAPFLFGTMSLEASQDDIAAASTGTYTGTVNFSISLGYY